MPSSEQKLTTTCGGVRLETPVIIASGTWPLGGPLWGTKRPAGVGAVSSKGLTLHPREGNAGTRLWETPSGLLNSIGLENPGIADFITGRLPEMARSDIPVLANVAVETLDGLEESLNLLGQVHDQIAGVELNVSCPNVEGGGMAWGLDERSVTEVLTVARKVWKAPLWLKLTPQTNDLQGVLKAAEKGGADAVVVANTWLGMAMDLNRKRPVFERTFAGLSGPAVFPLALRMVWQAACLTHLPVIGCGGVTGPEDALAMILAGARAVQVGTGMFVDLEMPSRITSGLKSYLKKNGYAKIQDIVGLARR